MKSEEIPVKWQKVKKSWKEMRNVQRTRFTCYETEGERLKAEAERSQESSQEKNTSRLSDEATKILEGGN